MASENNAVIVFKAVLDSKQFTNGTKYIQQDFKKIAGQSVQITKSFKKTSQGLKLMSTSIKEMGARFKMEYLGILFGGMAMKRLFTGIMQSSFKAFNSISDGTSATSIAMANLTAATAFLKFEIASAIGTAIQPLIPILVEWILKLGTLARAHPRLVSALLIGGAAIGSLLMVISQLVLGISSFAQAFGGVVSVISLVVSSIFSVIGGIIALGVVIGVMIYKWGFIGFLKNLWKGIKLLVLLIWEWGKVLVKKIINSKIIQWVKNLGKAISTWLIDKIKYLLDLMGRLIQKMKEIARAGFSKVQGAVTGMISKVFGKKQFGGTIDRDGLYNLHRGETVIPSGGTNFNGGINITLNTNSQISADSIAREIQQAIERRVSLQ